MRFCSHCNAQFPDDEVRCIHCGGRLRTAPEHAQENLPDPSRLSRVAVEMQAKVGPFLDRLREAGIPFRLVPHQGEIDGDADYGWKTKEWVYVAPSDRERAEQIYREFLEDMIPDLAEMESAARAPADCCPGCKAPLSPNAASCPSCGLVFPER